MKKFRWIIKDLKLGLKSGFPLCCIISYTIKNFLGVPQADRLKLINDNPLNPYKSCFLHKRGNINLEGHEYLLNKGWV